jgi:hypothetical protein
MVSELAQHAKEGFDKVVDEMVMKNLAKGAGIDLSALGVTAASPEATNNLPSGQSIVIER